jgi:hypothetical protein
MYATVNAIESNNKKLLDSSKKIAILTAKSNTLSANFTALSSAFNNTNKIAGLGESIGVLGAILEQTINLDMPESIQEGLSLVVDSLNQIDENSLENEGVMSYYKDL